MGLSSIAIKTNQIPLMLNHLKIIDLSSVLAGPSVATFFAELGAEVIKYEHPSRPDVTRSWKLANEAADAKVSAYFSSINYMKEYQTLDLTDEQQRAELLDELKTADMLIMNFKRTDYAKFGLDDQKLLDINPRLIIGKISGYGSDSDRVAYDLILQAESGFMSMNGTPESGPVKMPVALIDVLAAHHLKEALLLALYEREQTGQGQSVSVSLYDAAVSSLVNQASNYLMNDQVPKRIGSKHPNIAPYGELFKTQDDAWVTFAVGSDKQFASLCEVLELEELIGHELYKSNRLRVINRESLETRLADKVSIWSSQKLLQELSDRNVPAGKVKSLDEVFSKQSAACLIREEVISGQKTKRVASKVFTQYKKSES